MRLELARISLEDQTLESVLRRVVELAQAVVPATEAVSCTLTIGGEARTVASSDDLALAFDEKQYVHDSGPCLDSARHGTVNALPDARDETPWPAYTRDAAAGGLGSSLSLPVLNTKELGAALNLYSCRPHAFDRESTELAQTFASYASVVVANMRLYESTRQLVEQLQTAMESRAVIDQAKGILMVERRCSGDEAFELLVTLSQRSNRKLREVAQALVDNAERNEPLPG